MARPSKAAGSVALVTGANRGIGLAIVRELAARGAKKVYAGVRAPAGLAGEFGDLGAMVEVVPLDVTDRDAAQAAAAACADVNLLVGFAALDHAAAVRTATDLLALGPGFGDPLLAAMGLADFTAPVGPDTHPQIRFV